MKYRLTVKNMNTSEVFRVYFKNAVDTKRYIYELIEQKPNLKTQIVASSEDYCIVIESYK